jgi:hypothetical protein
METKPSQVIDRLGGTVETARLCQVSKGAVSQWRTNGIPQAREMYLRAVRPDAFDQTDDQKQAA